jgi:S-adenosylmethionine-diacylglycerol 3-amino-3-carboxypropyl transferase
MKREWKNKIYYSQCWEDPSVLSEALQIQQDDTILSITSGGCNTLALLLCDPKQIIALDINPAQNYLLELKMVAIQKLSYEELLSFLGVVESSFRLQTYKQLRGMLSSEAQQWWDNHSKEIKKGIIHCGKFEQYLRIFSKVILPFVHSKKTIQAVFESRTPAEQEKFYLTTWNSLRWRLVFKIFFSKAIMSAFGRNPNMFLYVNGEKLADYYFKKAEKVLSYQTEHNFFLQYIFLGNYQLPYIPPYLARENIETIRQRLDRIKIRTGNILDFLSSENHYKKYNLSNIFESLSSELTDSIFKAICTNSDQNLRIVYINHLVDRSFSSELAALLRHDSLVEEKANNETMTFFYKKTHVDCRAK